MAFLETTVVVLLFLWDLFKDWLLIFISPFKKPEMFWIIIPIWISWFFAEFFQEKKGTSFGNAISNGVIPLFVGIDWGRYITSQLTAHLAKFSYIIAVKYAICLIAIAYGLSIIIFGIKARQFVHFYGRIREVTYILVMFSPIVYGIIELNWKFLLSIVLFFPLFYYLIEIIDRMLPTPKIYEYDKGQQETSISGLGSDFNLPSSSNINQNLRS